MDPEQEQQVALGLQRGEIDAWHALYDAYCRRVWASVARRMGSETSDVADVVQETFLAAARSARSYDPARGSLWMWLGGIARRHVALHYRNRQRHDRLRDADDLLTAGRRRIVLWLGDDRDGETPLPDEPEAGVEVASMVRATLTELPSDYELLLTAKYFDGATVEEIAGARECSATAVRSKLARARRAFRKAFCRASLKTLSRDSSQSDDVRQRETT